MVGLALTLGYGGLAVVACLAALTAWVGKARDGAPAFALSLLLVVTLAATAGLRSMLHGPARVLPLALVDLLCVAIVMLFWSDDAPPRRTWKLALANTYVLHCVLYAVYLVFGDPSSFSSRYQFDLSHNIVFLIQLALVTWPSANALVESLRLPHRGRRLGLDARGAGAR